MLLLNFGHGEMVTDGNNLSMQLKQTIILEDVQLAAYMIANVTSMYIGMAIAGMEEWITLDH